MNFLLTPLQLQVIHLIADHLAQPGDLSEELHSVLMILSERLGMERGMISIFRRDLQEVHAVVTFGMDTTSEALRYKLGEGITGTVVKERKPIAVSNVNDEPLFLDRVGRKKFIREDMAFLCVPIEYGTEVVGALSVDKATRTDSGLDNELALLSAVARLIAGRVHVRVLLEENIELKAALKSADNKGMIIGNAPCMRELSANILQVARAEATVLITGETGTGKELIAMEMHRASNRSANEMITINCGAIPENLIESELFGHEAGAFTGAIQKHIGKFERADKGTLFLDEIGELPLNAQVKLLRVLQEQSFERVGGKETLRVNVRVIAATNIDLEEAVNNGKFRQDLYYRLNVFPIHAPPLRERGADIILLADYFVEKYATSLNKTIKRIDTPAIDMLIAYHWPGNVRELENCIERAAITTTDDVIHGHNLPPSLQLKQSSSVRSRGKFHDLVSMYEKELIIDALKDAKGNQTRAAKILGTSKRVVQYKTNLYAIDYKRFS